MTSEILAKFSRESVFGYALVLGCLLFHLWVSSVGWHNSLLDGNGFRQTQTALVARSFAEGQARLDYEVPVFADDSRIPFEFPIFQVFTALLHQATGLSLEESGRAMSLLFYFASLWPVYSLVAGLTGSQLAARLALVFMLMCPLYLYWSRDFLIESTALFFSVSFLAGAFHFSKGRRPCWLAVTLLCGLAAGLAKVTTFAVALAAASALFAAYWLEPRRRDDKRARLQCALGFTACVLVSVAAAACWTRYTDTVKLHSPMGATLTSSALLAWNFGTWQQRLDVGAWTHVGYYSFPQILGTYGRLGRVVLLGFVAFTLFLLARANRRERVLAVVFFGAFAIGPAVFWNLYQQHSYYWYANAVYFLIALAILIGNCAASNRSRWVLYAAVPLLVAQMLAGYFGLMFKGQRDGVDSEILTIAKVLEANVAPEELFLVFGDGAWNPRLAYYARRRALMYACGDAAFQQTFVTIDPVRFRAAVCFPGYDRAFAEEKCGLSRMGFPETPTMTIQNIDVYLHDSAVAAGPAAMSH